MKVNIHKIAGWFSILVLILAAIWLTKTCGHKPIVTSHWKIDSMFYYKNLAKKDSIDAALSEQQYEADYSHYRNPDSAGREELRARIWKNVQDADSISGAAPR
jgi:hypothetical protein